MQKGSEQAALWPGLTITVTVHGMTLPAAQDTCIKRFCEAMTSLGLASAAVLKFWEGRSLMTGEGRSPCFMEVELTHPQFTEKLLEALERNMEMPVRSITLISIISRKLAATKTAVPSA